jgi:putative ABC transport system permease protein
MGENIVIAWPARTSLPFEGLGKGRKVQVSEQDIEALRREIPEATFSGEYGKDNGNFRRERARLSPDVSANSPVFGVMRNLIPAAGGRYVNDLDMDRRRRVVFLGNKLKLDLFGKDEDAVGKTVMIDSVPFLVIGVMQEKAQDSSYGGMDEGKAFLPEATFRGLYGQRYVSNFIFQAKDPSLVPAVTRRVYEVLGRRHTFDPNDKEAVGMWDTTEGEKFMRIFFGTFRAFLGVIGSFTLLVGGIGVSNIMYVVVEERTREIGIKMAVGAKPRFILGQFLVETLTLTAAGGLLGFLITLGVIALFPRALDEYVGTPEASPFVILTTATLLGVIGTVAGYFPARRASQLDPVVALKLS